MHLKRKIDRMERKYKLSDVGNIQIIDMLKVKISAGAIKMRRHEDRELHYHQNTLIATHHSFTRNLMVIVTFKIKPLMLKKLLNFRAILGQYLAILTNMLHGSPR